MCATNWDQPCPFSPFGFHRFFRVWLPEKYPVEVGDVVPNKWVCAYCHKEVHLCQAECEARWHAMWEALNRRVLPPIFWNSMREYTCSSPGVPEMEE
ncbi:hypothetical protein CcaverHIS002_0309950 [Cutaneotrichosporon cavernicola]|nr:hypothetical protein CcaverHIS002_0309950 [Cutaneotrichosporon cavernicola]BEI98689.1 hypothetical protein CcaverHIS631_0309880 [Cutaneotrichosporon cavernicola]BEJ06459.1 hypothetical protein CcaverHIS641_0309810 [Cutaneotrichosporon cavernicola]